MLIYALGWHWKHPADFQIIRPEGVHGMQIILIRSKARICIGEQSYQVTPNTVFILDSCVPHSLFGDGEQYVDDWIRFDLETDDMAFLKELGVAFNVPIPLHSDIVSQLIAVCEQIFRANKAERDVTLRHLLTAIFMQIKADYSPTAAKYKTHYDQEFELIRQQIYENPCTDWNVAQIAKQLNMSVSHFQRLYKLRFGVPCSKDILTSRMEYAKQLLNETDLSAVEVAAKCGYHDYSHFSRVFTKYACVPPTKFRREK